MQVQTPTNRAGWRLSAVAGLLVAATVAAATALGGEGNYLIITPPEYYGSAPLNQFAAAKSGMGFTVSVYSVPAGTSRNAIKDHILSLWSTAGAPHYILIVGDTHDEPSTANTIPHWVGGGSRAAATDLPYACMDPGDDWYPEIYIGRFSVASVSQLQDVVDKSLYVEAGNFTDPNYVKRAAFLASSDTTTQSEQLHDWIISTYMEPAQFDCTRIYANSGGGTAQITQAANNGCLFMTYFGHSGSGGWSSPTYSTSNVHALTNDGRYGLVMGWSCNSAHYPTAECFGEAWLRQPHGGAAAYLSASSYVWWGDIEAWESSRRMEKYFYQSFFVDDIWEVRPAWHAALWRLLADPDFGPAHDHTRNIFEEFVLLGDPALLLPRGVGFALNATPASQDLCTPPQTQAEYAIVVEQYMGFVEPVTLTATGVPAGASVSFDTNNVPPPFAANMVVSGLGAGSAGSYTIQITGTSASMTRAAAVGLNVSNAAPGGVTLLTPVNGAIEVLRTPTLTWEAAAQGLTYGLEIARDTGFTNVVYSATVADSSHTLAVYLEADKVYYWHVRAVNACGIGSYSTAFSFTTAPQRDYFTELFVPEAHAFDLAGRTLALIPDGSDSFYHMCVAQITALPSDPAGGMALSLGDDTSVPVTPLQPVPIYGVAHNTFWVSANGYLTFNGSDGAYSESLSAHFNRPRVSALFDDLNPASGGSVSWKMYSDRVVVTWLNVPEYGTINSNTFQIELFLDGEIHISWLGIGVRDCLVGVSAGNGIPGDFLEMDLSAGLPCTGADFMLAAVPSSQAVCAPAVAPYQIEVSASLGFNQPVYLSAVGVPAGASVGFSISAAVPPFTSVMTIGNTPAAPAGDYLIQVVGEAGAMQRDVIVGFHLDADVPPAVVLMSPVSGAVGVSRTPTLSWQDGGAGAYDLEVATDAAFSQVIYSQNVEGLTHTLQTGLLPAALYYWRVRGVNTCGQGEFSTEYHFTTIEQPDYFTELFSPTSGNCDLQNYTVRFIPDGTGDYYRVCGFGTTVLPTDPAGGTTLTLGDDAFVQVTPGGPVWLYGASYGSLYVGSNGYVTFVAGDGGYNESLAAHFSAPRVSALFDDLNPSAGGTVSWKETASGVAVTWLEVPEYSQTAGNTFQIELLDSGEVRITWLGLAAIDGLAGLSQGLGVPPDFQETNLSAVGGCAGDLNLDGYADLSDVEFLAECMNGPGVQTPPSGVDPAAFARADLDGDGDVDVADLALLSPLITDAG